MGSIKGDISVLSMGAYVPRHRLNRAEVVRNNVWANGSLASWSRSERSVCGWDEDVVTMAVEAARECLAGHDRSVVDGLHLATTTSPFEDRSAAALVAAALVLREDIGAVETAASRRAGTAALLAAADGVAARGRRLLCIASEQKLAAAGTVQELATGHAATAILLGPGPGLARLVGDYSLTVDFVDSYRGRGHDFDYQWEERWVREEGYQKIVPRLVAGALDAAGLEPSDIDRFCLPCPLPRVAQAVAKRCGIRDTALTSNLGDGCGDTGTAHALLMLAQTLEHAEVGAHILVASFGEGGDAIIFQVTDRPEADPGVSPWLARGREMPYAKYLALSGLLTVDRGIRSELDKGTALSVHARHRDLLDSMVGGRCTKCGTLQIPRSRVCVNPDCGAWDSQERQVFSEFEGRVRSCTADRLTYTPEPPAFYGMVDFEAGGNLMMDFTDIGEAGVNVGDRMRMVFRVKDHDPTRGFRRYFWKATPIE